MKGYEMAYGMLERYSHLLNDVSQNEHKAFIEIAHLLFTFTKVAIKMDWTERALVLLKKSIYLDPLNIKVSNQIQQLYTHKRTYMRVCGFRRMSFWTRSTFWTSSKGPSLLRRFPPWWKVEAIAMKWSLWWTISSYLNTIQLAQKVAPLLYLKAFQQRHCSLYLSTKITATETSFPCPTGKNRKHTYASVCICKYSCTCMCIFLFVGYGSWGPTILIICSGWYLPATRTEMNWSSLSWATSW